MWAFVSPPCYLREKVCPLTLYRRNESHCEFEVNILSHNISLFLIGQAVTWGHTYIKGAWEIYIIKQVISFPNKFLFVTREEMQPISHSSLFVLPYVENIFNVRHKNGSLVYESWLRLYNDLYLFYSSLYKTRGWLILC